MNTNIKWMERKCYKIRFYADDIQLFMSPSHIHNRDNPAHPWIPPQSSVNLTHLIFPAFKSQPCTLFCQIVSSSNPYFQRYGLHWVFRNQSCLWPARLICAPVNDSAFCLIPALTAPCLVSVCMVLGLLCCWITQPWNLFCGILPVGITFSTRPKRS